MSDPAGGAVSADELDRLIYESIDRVAERHPDLRTTRHRDLAATIAAHSKYSEEQLADVSYWLLEDVAANLLSDGETIG